MRTQIPWKNLSREEWDLIEEIAVRALGIATNARIKVKKLHIVMDLAACHLIACPLDLFRMLASDDANLAHDIFGIRRHLNRDTCQLEDCFLPRFAKLEEKAA